MKKITKEDLNQLSKVKRLNLINSVTGYKSANLLGTIDADGNNNLAVFSSITHLGSAPALLSFILRPTTVERHTYENMMSVKSFTVNHVNKDIIKQAHQTSAKYSKKVSEFDATGLTPEFKERIKAPFVKESAIQIACNYLNSYPIKENGCIMVVASIEEIFYNEKIHQEDYWLQLDKAETVCINGIDGYALPKLLDRFAYAKPQEETYSKLK